MDTKKSPCVRVSFHYFVERTCLRADANVGADSTMSYVSSERYGKDHGKLAYLRKTEPIQFSFQFIMRLENRG